VPVLVRTQGNAGRAIRAAEVRRRAERMLGALGLSGAAELSVLLCDDATIRELNRTFRRIDRPTDVLAFPMEERSVLGDVAISIDTARRQARRERRSLLAEVTHLLAHGLLHLLGHDHRTRAEERRMTARTDLLVAAAHSLSTGRRSHRSGSVRTSRTGSRKTRRR
jgi:probable rRNA maturation factor